MLIKRNRYLDELKTRMHNGLVKVITGMRRCGKSFLLFKIFKQELLDQGVDSSHIIEMSFDSYENKQFRDPAVLYPHILEQIKDGGQYYILLDEVQLLSEFVDVLNGLIAKGNLDIYVTGSNARFLSHDVITEFRGRGDEIHMYPLSFCEFCSVYEGNRRDAFDEYLLYGGLPSVVNLAKNEQKIKFLKALFEETYISDIINRYHIRNDGELQELINILASAIGSLTNPKKLSDSFQSLKQVKLSPPTLKKYIDYLADSFLITGAKRFDIKGRKYINSLEKYYFTDLGLRNARLNFRQIEPTHAMENIIFNELNIRGFNVDVGIVNSFETNEKGNGIRKQLEVDFVCNLGSKRYYIQSAFAMPDREKEEQEQRSLLKIGDEFRKIIVTKDCPAPHYNDKGVLMIGIYDFLLNEHSLDF